MKTHNRFVLPAICLGTAGLVGVFQIELRDARAAGPSTPEQYKILIPGSGAFPDEEALQEGLNKLAKEGWKVRTADPVRIIVAK
jgi:hypothetical protein